ncbi:MAG: hypothetical protein AB4372_36920 [Xenococcus sp. (in: cyanobacteria)]
MNHKKLLLMTIGFGLVFFYSPEAALAQANQSTLTVGMPSTSRISVSVDPVQEGNSTSGPGQSSLVIGKDVSISQDVFVLTVSKLNTTGEITPDTISICLTDCGAITSGNSTSGNSISLNDLATLVQSDLNQALNNLVAAQEAASDGTVAPDNSRQIVRTESDANANCDCVPGETKIVRELTNSQYSSTRRNLLSVTEAREIVETKLKESSTFVEQINQFNPENRLW